MCRAPTGAGRPETFAYLVERNTSLFGALRVSQDRQDGIEGGGQEADPGDARLTRYCEPAVDLAVAGRPKFGAVTRIDRDRRAA